MVDKLHFIVFFLFLFLALSNEKATKKQKNKVDSLSAILPHLMKDERSRIRNLTNRHSAARYMMNLYQNIDVNNDNLQGFNVSNVTTTKQVEDADTIMGILNDDSDARPVNYKMRIKFSFTAKIRRDESAVEVAELHVYKDQLKKNAWMANATFLVELSVITRSGNAVKLSSNPANYSLQGWETRWIVFDVTDTVDKWIVSPGNNFGLELLVTLQREKLPVPLDPAVIGFIDFKGPLEKRPFIVSFFKGDPTEKKVVTHATSRKRRSVFSQANLKYGNRNIRSQCKKRFLYVDFRELRWENWIIYPAGYETSYCAGACTYGSYDKVNATNHAIIQSVVNLFNADSAPAPCCAPTQLKAISLLYIDDNSNIVMKKYQNMAVKSCGCH